MPLHTRVIETDFEQNLTNPRMRAFYWRYLAAQEACEGDIPHISDLSDDAFAGLEPWSLRLLALPDGDFVYTQYGHEISRTTGFSMVGKSVSSSSSRAFKFFLTCYQRVRDEHIPLVTFSSALASRSLASWNRLMVPACDDAGQLNIITVLQPVHMHESVTSALLQAISDPVLILKMIRDGGEEVVDANILDANAPAEDLFNRSYLNQCILTDIMPSLLDEPYHACLAAAYAEGRTATIDRSIDIAGRSFAGITAYPIGDGAALLLHPA